MTDMALTREDPTLSESGSAVTFKPLFRYDGTVAELLPIVLVNAGLNVLTLTLWRFWGRTRVRRYLWSRVSLDGDRFEYSGTGLELLLGFLIVFFAVLVPYGLLMNHVPQVLADKPILLTLLMSVSTLLVCGLIGAAIYRARRYRLSRTQWRGVRAAQVGSAGRYGLTMVLFLVGCVFTAGLLFPLMRLSLARYRWRNTIFGNQRFGFEGGVRELYIAFTISLGLVLAALPVVVVLSSFLSTALLVVGLSPINLVLTEPSPSSGMVVLSFFFYVGLIGIPLVLVGIAISSFYLAREAIVIAESVTMGKTRFRFQLLVPDMVGLLFGNILILVFTLGFGAPFVTHRMFKFICARLEVAGEPDYEAIHQSAELTPRHGEGLAEGVDVGAV